MEESFLFRTPFLNMSFINEAADSGFVGICLHFTYM